MYEDTILDAEDQPRIFILGELSLANEILQDEVLSAERANELTKIHVYPSLPNGFHYDDQDWLIYEKENEDENSSPIKICSKLEVIARTRDQIGENHGRLLQFTDSDGIIHNWSMPMELLAGDGALYRQELLSKGLLIAPGSKARQLLAMFIQTSIPKKAVRCVNQTGWNKERTAFVSQHETIGKAGDEDLILQTCSNLPITQAAAGSLEEWKKGASLCVGNSRLIFATSASFAPPLLNLLGMENGGIHFRGGSSSGKTTCLKMAASVWGSPNSLQQWRATVNGLEGIAAAYNDCLLCLDEMGQMDPAEIGHVAYMLANGVGKARADKKGDSRLSKQWRLIFLSSGEIALSGHMAEAKQRIRAGQEVRVLDIPADGQKYGCFDELHDFKLAKAFSEHLVALCASNHGTAGPMFIKSLISMQEKVIQNVPVFIEDLTKKYVPINASGQVYRAFNRFALVAIAGELATTFGVTGWSEGMAITAAMSCFKDWLRARGDAGPQEERVILSQVKHFFEQHGDSRFSPWKKEAPDQVGKTIMRAGFRKLSEHGEEEFFVFIETFKREIASGFDHEIVAQVCLKHGLLIPDSKNCTTRSERLPGAKKSARVYRFNSKVLGEEE